MKEIKQDTVVPRRPVTHIDCRNNDYITTFHFAGQPSVEDLQPCTTDMDSGLCGLLNAPHQVTITYRHSDATDSPMFSLAPMLPISDVQCVNRPNSTEFSQALVDQDDCTVTNADHPSYSSQSQLTRTFSIVR